MQALAGMLLAALTFAGAWWAGRGKSLPPLLWPRIVALALIPSVLFGWTIETVPVDSYDIGGWLRALAFAATAAVAPIACAAAYAADRRQPSFAALLGRLGRPTDALSVAFGVSLIALTLLSVLTALGLVFDPRYRDLPFAPQSGAVIAFLVLMVSTPRKSQLSTAGSRAVAETLAAAVLTVSAVYIAINETLANWQAVWLCAGLIGLAIILVRARNAPD
jgi:hypothetical protein